MVSLVLLAPWLLKTHQALPRLADAPVNREQNERFAILSSAFSSKSGSVLTPMFSGAHVWQQTVNLAGGQITITDSDFKRQTLSPHIQNA